MRFIFIALLLSLMPPKSKLVGKRMPEFMGTTIAGKKINTSYFNGKVTFVSFMQIGCPPCMYEIKALNRIRKHADFQVLIIAPHTADQLQQFNSSAKNRYSVARKYFGVDSIKFEILPECATGKDTGNTIRPQCDNISKLFKVDGYPASFLIDRSMIIRKAYEGFSDGEDSVIVKIIQNDINAFLN